MPRDKINWYVKNPHGVVVIVGDSEVEAIKRKIDAGEKFEILEKVPDLESGGSGVQLPEKKADPLECPICGTKGVGRNRFRKPEDVKNHVAKKHAD